MQEVGYGDVIARMLESIRAHEAAIMWMAPRRPSSAPNVVIGWAAAAGHKQPNKGMQATWPPRRYSKVVVLPG